MALSYLKRTPVGSYTQVGSGGQHTTGTTSTNLTRFSSISLQSHHYSYQYPAIQTPPSTTTTKPPPQQQVDGMLLATTARACAPAPTKCRSNCTTPMCISIGAVNRPTATFRHFHQQQQKHRSPTKLCSTLAEQEVDSENGVADIADERVPVTVHGGGG